MPKLGEVLLKNTSISQDQLNDALKIQYEEGGLLGEILVRKNMLALSEIVRALCLQLGIPFLDDLKPNEIDPLLVSNIPINYAKTKEALPISQEVTPRGTTLTVAVAGSPPSDGVRRSSGFNRIQY